MAAEPLGPALGPSPHALRHATPSRQGHEARAGFVVILGCALALIGNAFTVAVESRAEVLGSIVLEVLAWAFAMALMLLRHPRRQLRISDPGVLVLAWSAFYFIIPAITFAQGKTFQLETSGAIRLTSTAVIHAQYLHVLFLLAFAGAYHLLAPRYVVEPLPLDEILVRSPPVAALLLIGLLPVALEVVDRALATGSLRPTGAYGDSWAAVQEGVRTARVRGGADYLVTQITGKLWYLPLMCIGAGLGVVLARLLRARRWVALTAFHGIFPVLMYFNSGGRSGVITSYLIALLVADLLVGPISWRYLLAVVIAGTLFFDFYGSFRRYQNESIGTAITLARGDARSATEIAGGEESAMLVKDVFAVAWTDSTGIERGGEYFWQAVLTLIPSQLVPGKVQWINTANLLSRELLGRDAEYGAGVAGAIIADGYMIAREPGIFLLAAALALLAALVVRGLLRPTTGAVGPPLWRVVLLGCFGAQTFVFIRGDLGTAILQVVYYILLPAGIALALLSPRFGALWRETLVVHVVGSRPRPGA